MNLRKILFWLHLIAGVIAGSVILIMSVTGVLLAYERQILAWAEHVAIAPPTPAAPRLSLDLLVENARAAAPKIAPSGITLQADLTAPVVVNLGREDLLLADPYTGAVLGEGAKSWRAFFHFVEDWHRWLATSGGNRPVGKAVTGACNAAFVVLTVTGLYLWWPRKWSRPAVRSVAVINPRLHGRARDWNWHNAIGLWCAPFLFFIALTGVVMSYPWATDLIYRLTKSQPPGQSRPGGRPGNAPPAYFPPASGFDALVRTAKAQVPAWKSMNLRLPPKPGGPISVAIEEPDGPHVFARSMLTLDGGTAKILKWEPFKNNNLGRKIRSWVRPIHTGEAGGFLGQTVALLASLGGVVLVWTGLALSWRRFQVWRAKRRPLPTIAAD